MEAMDISSVILQKSNDFLRNMLRGAPDEMNIRYFRQLSPVLLENLSEEEKKVFWVNLYNAFVQKELYGMNMDRVDKSIFTRKNINIAGQGLSLSIHLNMDFCEVTFGSTVLVIYQEITYNKRPEVGSVND